MDKENSVVFTGQTHIAINFFYVVYKLKFKERFSHLHFLMIGLLYTQRRSAPLHPSAPSACGLMINLYCLVSPVNTYHVPSPSSSTGRAMCAQAWRSPSTSLHTTSQNTTSALHRPPSHQYKVIPQTRCFLLWLICR